ncbi:hypothetical protein IFM89_016768 [Coptis chinensis]|uniref:Uncharacterized protein n=1 Tax=Coptis chinensis TaxID=261450 RepID=A0A835LMG7_9MAGN|nr:hypothetical protein IFM89_016768 [Coptis chinensis]
MFGSRKTSLLNWIDAMLSVGIIVFVIITGFVKGDASNLSPFLFRMEPEVCLKASPFCFRRINWFRHGCYNGEETKKPSRYSNMDVNAAFSVAFKSVGMNWANYSVFWCTEGDGYKITTGLMVGALGQGRLSQDLPSDLQKLRCKGLIEFKKKGKNMGSDLTGFLDFIEGLDLDANSDRLKSKLREVETKFGVKKSGGIVDAGNNGAGIRLWKMGRRGRDEKSANGLAL